MKTLPDDAFVPKQGKLSQLLHENPDRGISPRLEFSIEIPFEAFELEDEDEVSTALWISGIRADEVKSWRGIENQSLGTSLMDGSIRLFQAMNPVELDSLKFGVVNDGIVEVELEGEIDFEMEGNDEYGVVPISLNCELEIAGLRIATSIDKRLKSDESAIIAAAGEGIEWGAYGSLEKVPGGIQFPIGS